MPGGGVASLRIKGKDSSAGPHRHSSHKKKSEFGAGEQHGDAEDDSALASTERAVPLSSDFDLVAQTSYSGELYKSARWFHLFLPVLPPNQSHYIIPSTAVPGVEGEFLLQVFGATPSNALRLDACTLVAPGDGSAGGGGFDSAALASKRGSIAMGMAGLPGGGAGLASMKIKAAPKGSEKKKKK